MTFAREDLGSDIVLSYNGFVFPTSVEIIGFRTTPVPDKAGRTFIGLRHEITARFSLDTYPRGGGGNGSLDASIPTIRATLMQQGGLLQLQNTGFGTYIINPEGGNVIATDTPGLRDLAWGPIPKLLEETGFYKYGAYVTWKVEFLLNACTGGTQTSDILEWTYGLTFDIDRSGYTTRRLQGSVSIPMTRKTVIDRTLSGNVDALRERITPGLAIGFRRDYQSFTLSEDKRALSFSFADVEMPPNIPPAGVVIAEGSHDLDWQFTSGNGSNPLLIVQTIRASYELPKTRARGEAFNHFLNLVKYRTAILVKKAQQKALMLLPVRFHAGEPELYGRKTAEFALTYTVQYKEKGDGVGFLPTSFLQDSGMWQPLPDSNYAAWAASMAKYKVSVPRGTANLVWNPAEDAIVDLCAGATVQPVELSGKPPSMVSRILAALGGTKAPSPDNSWLKYESRIKVQQHDNTVVLRPLPVDPVLYTPRNVPLEGYQPPYTDSPANIVQIRGGPVTTITLEGKAARGYYPIEPPQLLSLGGMPVYPCNGPRNGFSTETTASAGIPIVGAAWSLRYVVGAPIQLKQAMQNQDWNCDPPPNPILGIVADPNGDLEMVTSAN